jgi:hypothetical protein
MTFFSTSLSIFGHDCKYHRRLGRAKCDDTIRYVNDNSLRRSKNVLQCRSGGSQYLDGDDGNSTSIII